MNRSERFVRTLPLPVKAAAKRIAFRLDAPYRLLHRLRTRERRPIPPLALRAQIGSGHDIGVFFESGRANAEYLEGVLAAHGRSFAAGPRVLDFGAGCVRVLSQVDRIAGGRSQLSGCDVNGPAIAWADRAYPSFSVAVNDYDPPLPYADQSFDVIYSLSIFTHLPLDSHEPWLRELDRVLAPGGIAIVTTSGVGHWSAYRSGEMVSNSQGFIERVQAAPALEETGAVFVAYDRTHWNERDFAGITDDYGIASLTREHVEQEWSRVFEVLEVREAALADQDVVVLAKR